MYCNHGRCYAGEANIQIQLQNFHSAISTSQSDDRIIIRFLISRNKRNDYRLNWNSFKWKQTRRRLIRKERCLAIHGSRYFEKRSTSLFGECCCNLMVNVMVNVLRRVKGWPALHALPALCLWLLDDCQNGGAGQLWCRHQCTSSLHSNSSFNLPCIACSAMPVISTYILYQAFCGRTRKLWNFKVELVMMIASANIWDDYDCYDDNDDNWSTHHLKRMT